MDWGFLSVSAAACLSSCVIPGMTQEDPPSTHSPVPTPRDQGYEETGPPISSNTPITEPCEEQQDRTGPAFKALGIAHPSIHSHCFCVASEGSCPVWRLPSHPATFCWLCCLSGLLAKAPVFVFFCRALAQLFVLRDHMAIAGRAVLSRPSPGAGSPTLMWGFG